MADNKNTIERAKWSGKWAFVISAAASAVGLGNFWRFPYLAAQNGGGTFLLMNLIFTLTFGVALLILEISLGRNTGLSAIGAFSKLNKKFKWIGIFVAFIPLLILPYYCVIGGWVVKFIGMYITSEPEVLANSDFFNTFLGSESMGFVFMSLFILITFVIVFRGVKGGIEKVNMFMMPALILFAVALAVYVALDPGSHEGFGFFFMPDFSKMSPQLVMSALGQTFFSLSLAMGIMITYGSYLNKESSITHSSFQISGCAFGVSVLSGMIIIPAAFAAFGGAPEEAGATLMFVTLPKIFLTMGPAAKIVGIVFFVLVLFAAITSSISIAEACVSIICDSLKVSRHRVSAWLFVYALIAGAFVNAGYNVGAWFDILGMSLLELVDWFTNSLMMPIAAILTCVVIGWFVKPDFLVQEVKKSSKFRSSRIWIIMVKYICPIFVFAILVSNLIAVFS